MSLQLPDQWSTKEERPRYDKTDRNPFLKEDKVQRSDSRFCPECGEESFMVCDSCGYSKVSESFIDLETSSADIVSYYKAENGREEAIQEKIAYYQNLLDEVNSA